MVLYATRKKASGEMIGKKGSFFGFVVILSPTIATLGTGKFIYFRQ